MKLKKRFPQVIKTKDALFTLYSQSWTTFYRSSCPVGRYLMTELHYPDNVQKYIHKGSGTIGLLCKEMHACE